MPTAETDPRLRTCPACGGRLRVLVRLRTTEAHAPRAYFKCDRCAHVIVADE